MWWTQNPGITGSDSVLCSGARNPSCQHSIFTGVSLFSTLSPSELLIGTFSHLYPSFMIEVMQIKSLFLSFCVRCVLWYLVIGSKALKITLTFVPDLCLYWFLPPVSVAGRLVSTLQTVSLHRFILPLFSLKTYLAIIAPQHTHTLSLNVALWDFKCCCCLFVFTCRMFLESNYFLHHLRIPHKGLSDVMTTFWKLWRLSLPHFSALHCDNVLIWRFHKFCICSFYL